MTNVERNKSAASSFFEQVFNKGNFSVMASLSPNYRYNGAPQKPEGFIAWVEAMRARMPDLNFVIEDILGEDDKVALRWRMRGTTAGGGATPAGVAVETTGTNILTFDPQGLCLTNVQNGYATFTAPGQQPITITDDAIYSPPAAAASKA